MPIFGTGVDIVNIPRVTAMLSRRGIGLAKKLLAKQEIERFLELGKAVSNFKNEFSKQQARFLAKRFAAKEAAVKALRSGFRGILFSDVLVVNDSNGAPQLQFKGKMQAIIEEFGISASHLSLADEADYAIAYVVLECSETAPIIPESRI